MSGQYEQHPRVEAESERCPGQLRQQKATCEYPKPDENKLKGLSPAQSIGCEGTDHQDEKANE